MNYEITYQPVPGGGVQVIWKSGRQAIGALWTREDARRHVIAICQNAGLPAPWGGK